MKNKFAIFFLLFLSLKTVMADDSVSKLTLLDKKVITEGIKLIDDIKIVLESDVAYKVEEAQEVFFRTKGESGSYPLLILNNDSMVYVNEISFLENKFNCNFLTEKIEIADTVLKGILYKNITSENSKVWKKYFTSEYRKSDSIFVLKDEKLIAVEGVIKEIEKDKVKISWDGQDKTISLEKIVGILFATNTEKFTTNFEVQTIEGSKFYCATLLFNEAGNCKIGFKKDEVAIQISTSQIGRIIFQNRKAIYLSMLEPFEIENENFLISLNSNWEKDQSVWKKPLSIGSKTYSKGLGVHAYNKLKYRIPSDCIQFNTDFGIDSEVINNAGCIFKIVVDKKEFLNEIVNSSNGVKNIMIELPPNSKEISLIVEPGPNLDLGDHGVWGSARFIKK